MANKEPKQNLAELVDESQGDIAGRFDLLDETIHIVIFETPYEVGVYRAETDSPRDEIKRLRTRVSGKAVPQVIASMNKRSFYTNNMLAALCSPEIKKERHVNYYRI